MLRASIVVALMAWPLVAIADPEPIRIEYSAAPGCPSAADVVARLRERASIRRVDADARVFAFAIAPDGAAYRGELAVRDAGDVTSREVTAASCDEVVHALVVVAALAIEERVAARRAEPVLEHPARWQLAFGTGFARYAGVTPSARLGIPVHLEVGRGNQALRATFDVTARDDVAMASFQWLAGRLEACPYVWRIGRFTAAPCAGLQAGVLRAEGTVAFEAMSRTRPWLAPELVGRVGVTLGRFHVELEGLVAAPLVRDRYYIAPATTIHQVPAAAFGLGSNVAIDFL